MTSAEDNHVDHSLGDTWTGDREIREQIIQRGDRWSVVKWPPTDQLAEKSGDRSPRTVIGGQ